MKSEIKSFVSILLVLLLVLSPLLTVPVMAAGEAIAIAVELKSFRDEGDSGYTQNVGGDAASTLLWKKEDADATNGYLRLVPDALWKSGTVVRRSQIQLTNGFSTYFSFLMTTSGTTDLLVDGLAFLVYESDSVQIGEYAGGLGYKGIDPSIAVEFDNYKNTELSDPYDEHVAIMVNGDPNHADEPSGSVVEYTDLERNTIHAWVDYNNGSVTATFGTSSTQSDPANKTITRNVGTFLQGKNVFVGFSSSTGGAGGNHDLLKWYFKDSYVSGGLSAEANAYTQAASSVGITFDSDTNANAATITTYDAAGAAMANQIVSIYIDGVKQSGTFSTGSNGTLAHDLTNVYGGKHEIRVVADGGATKATEFNRDSIDTSAGNATYVNPTPVQVDPELVVRGFSESHMIPGARVTIDNFKSGDRLTPPASLPTGVTSTWDSNTGSLEFSGNILASELQALLRAVSFQTTSTEITRRSVTFSLGSALPGDTGHFYDYVAASLNWTDAKNAAAAKTYLGLQGYMATITSQEENDLIATKVNADAWIGASDSASEGNWYWVTGPETGLPISTGNYSSTAGTPIVASGSYMNWASGEPNDYLNGSPGEDYAHIYSTQGGTWNDFPHTKTIGYIVEYGGMSAYPVLSLAATRSIDMVFTYKITYSLDGGTNYTGAPTSYTNTSETITFGTPARQGYAFDGWYDASTGGNKITSLATGSTGDKTFYARWTPATNTAYLVEHYQEKVDGSGYVLKETDLKTGTTGTTVTAKAATYTGFAENTSASGRVASGTVAADGSLVLKLYYDRNDYTVTFKDYDTAVLGTDTVAYEGSATAPASSPTRVGYTFTGWSPNYTSITSDLTVTAQYAANTDTAYKVEHYQQDVTGSGYTLKDTDNMTGTTASSVAASAKTYTGFSESTSIAGRVASGTIAADGSLVLKLYYDRETVSVTFVDHDDDELSQQTVRYEGSATPPTDPKRAGYTFAGWSGDYTEVTSDQTVTATYTANLNTPYLVKHYQQNITDDGYTLKDTDELSGETDTEATALAKEYDGFSENTSHSDKVLITGDGELVLKLYYDRDEVTVTFKDFDEITVRKTETVRYEGSVTPPANPTRLGYTFNGWSGTYNSVTSDQTVLATYSPNTTTRYTVEHYQQDVTGDGYTLRETENLTGTTDTTVTASAKSYTGFAENTTHSSKVAIGTVAANESLVLKLYYDRLTYSVTFTNHDDAILKEETIRFEGDATPPVDPTRTGYTFHSWDGDYTRVTAAQTIKATYTANINTIYTVEHYQQNITDDGYTLKETEVLSGTTDTAATATAKTYTGFLENTTHDERMSTGNIDGDGSRVLKLFYDRKTYTVTFKNHDNSVLENETVRYGGDATPPTDPIRAGYTFMDWNGTYASITKSETVWAVFSANTTTPYRVLHYQQDVTGDGFTLTAEENLTGTTDTPAAATVRTVTGFHEDTSHVSRVISGQIEGDGSLVLKVYYARDVFTVDFVDTDGDRLKSEVVRYQGNATPPRDPRRVRYDFTGWEGNYRNIQQNEIVKATFSIIKLAGTIEIESSSSSLFDQENAGLIAAPELWNSNVESVIYYLKDIQITDITNRFNYLDFAAANLRQFNHLMLQVYDLTLMKKVIWLDGKVTEDPVDNADLMGNITVRLPLAPRLAGYSDLQVVFIDDAGNIAFLPTTIVIENGQKYLEFENNHFSMYAVAASSTLPPIPATSDDSSPKTSPFLATVYGIAILLLGLVLAWYRWMIRRRRDEESISG